jgi:hypothetical protein
MDCASAMAFATEVPKQRFFKESTESAVSRRQRQHIRSGRDKKVRELIFDRKEKSGEAK